MPEFRVKWRDSLNRHLSDQGVKDVFDPMSADLQFMLPNADDAFVKQVSSPLSIRKIFDHLIVIKTFIRNLGSSCGRLQS